MMYINPTIFTIAIFFGTNSVFGQPTTATDPTDTETDDGWSRIPLTNSTNYVLPDLSTRVLNPSCSGGPIMENGELIEAPTEYSFFLKKGKNSRKLLIFFEGGGACWDEETCVSSPLSGNSTYDQDVGHMRNQGRRNLSRGVFDETNQKNPYKDYTKVVIPYCTADWFWGSHDKEYEVKGELGSSISWTIRHRGVDNFLSVFDWLKKSPDVRLGTIRDLSLMGTETGGYGALLSFFYLADLVPSAQISVVSEGSVGVINEEFFKLAFYNPDDADNGGNWGVEDVLPTWGGFGNMFLPNTHEQPHSFVPKVLGKMRDFQTRSNIALITSTFDKKQVETFMLMTSYTNETLPSYYDAKMKWYDGMKDITRKVKRIPASRIHVERGSHFSKLSKRRYFMSGETGVPLNQWLEYMIGWESLQADIDDIDA